VKSRLLGLLAVGLLVGPIGANAVPVTYDFTVNGGPTGPLAGVTSSGSFTFDDSIIPSGGGMLQQANLLTDLAFTWNGIAYTESTANTGLLTFDSGGTLVPMFFFGNDCGAGVCGVSQGVNQWYFQVADEGVFFEYGVPGIVGIRDGSGSFSLRQSSVPEPATLALLGIAIAALGFAHRRKASSSVPLPGV
jgi:hypothetical protein